MEENKKNNYSASSISVLEGLEAVRKRPGMYIGSTSQRGLHHLLYEVLDNSVDESLAGYCDTIYVSILEDNIIEISDNGRGIPVDKHSSQDKSALEVVMTVLHAGGKFGQGGYKISGGLHGVGVSVVNALSNWLEVEIKRDGNLYFQKYNLGVPEEDVKVIGSAEGTGTKVRFKPEPTIFETIVYDFNVIAKRCRELAYLNSGLRIILSDKRDEDPVVHDYFFEGGILDFVKDVSKDQKLLVEPIYMKGEDKDVIVEIALSYNETQRENLLSFVNNINTHEGGTHVSGFKSALTRIFNDMAKETNLFKGKEGFTGNDVREGIIAVISAKVSEPQFEGQTKTKLGNSNVSGIVSSIVLDKLRDYFIDHPKAVKVLIDKMLISKKAREAAKKAREVVLRKNPLEVSTLPGKLSDCSSKDPKESELFLVEGKSAAGTSKGARDRKTQAILPLKGKILNVEKAGLVKALSNEEIRCIVKALGAGVGDEFNLDNLRYHKIIIMADADADGGHIAGLALVFFYRFMPGLIENGHLYLANPPLFGLKRGKKIDYYLDNESLQEAISKLGPNDRYNVQRYKGLGEMEVDQLWDTAMDPESRRLTKIEVGDAEAADRMFSILLGDDVDVRKKFIQDNAINVKTLDV